MTDLTKKTWEELGSSEPVQIGVKDGQIRHMGFCNIKKKRWFHDMAPILLDEKDELLKEAYIALRSLSEIPL